MERIRIDPNTIDISKATPVQITRAQRVVDLPWSKRLFDNKLSYDEALRYVILRDTTDVITTATEGNITALFGLTFQPK